ncbi:MAG: FIG00455704: hypothetical protein [uncultured Paraburkholderia sp.]|nr:MAG: FIG00455704: hypothetical protein [uncultured Paraburkholderia sp.]CAH2912307.1 MAG: FIG00455704: hypothetical protein [uncultured Paraburkholderia sp.]
MKRRRAAAFPDSWARRVLLRLLGTNHSFDRQPGVNNESKNTDLRCRPRHDLRVARRFRLGCRVQPLGGTVEQTNALLKGWSVRRALVDDRSTTI